MMIGRLLLALLFCAAGSALAEGSEGVVGVEGVEGVEGAAELTLGVGGSSRAGGWGVTLRYDFLYNGFKVGDVTEVFRADAGGGYVLESHAAATGLAALLHGDVRRGGGGRLDSALGFIPEFYEEKRGPRPRQRAEFDRGRGVVILHRGEDERREERLGGAVYDYLSAVYLSYILGRPAGGTLAVTDGWRLKSYVYEDLGVENVRTPAGEFSAVRMSRADGKTRIFWLAEELDYLPVRIYVDDKGHIFESVLTGAERR